jgi:uncharacterized membrane protein
VPERSATCGEKRGYDESTGTRDSFAPAERIAKVFEDLGIAMAIGLGLLLGVGLFVAAAVLGSRNALWVPGVVLIAAAVGSLVT